MTQTIDEPTTPDAGDSRRGMDRRTLIKSAAAAGAVAWTAPIVIESLVSPGGRCAVGLHHDLVRRQRLVRVV